jgi:hypothetical protein
MFDQMGPQLIGESTPQIDASSRSPDPPHPTEALLHRTAVEVRDHCAAFNGCKFE